MMSVLGLLVLLGAANESPPVATIGEQTQREVPVLIQPFNYDPADPWEYTRRKGVRSPESLAASTIWNRPPGYR